MRLSFGSRTRPTLVKLPAREAYDALAEIYDGLPNPMLALERGAMAEVIPPLAGLTVADLGCGTGRYAAHALERGARSVYALDLSRGMLQKLRERRAADSRLHLLQADMQELPLADGALDGILSGLALGYAARLVRAVAEMGRVVRPGGFVLLSDLHPIGPSLGWEREYLIGRNGSLARIRVEHHPYSFERLFDLFFDAGFCLDELREVPVGAERLAFARGFRERWRVRRLAAVSAVAVLRFIKD